MTGVYILPHPQPERWFGRYNYAIFKKSIFIPWPEMTFTTGRVPFAGECIWLRLEPRRIYLYVPRAIGMKLLQAGGRDIPN